MCALISLSIYQSIKIRRQAAQLGDALPQVVGFGPVCRESQPTSQVASELLAQYSAITLQSEHVESGEPRANGRLEWAVKTARQAHVAAVGERVLE